LGMSTERGGGKKGELTADNRTGGREHDRGQKKENRPGNGVIRVGGKGREEQGNKKKGV